MSALFPYLDNNLDIFELQVKQSKITTRVRNYLQSDNEISVKTTDEDQCFEYLGVRSDFGPVNIDVGHGDVYLFGDETRLFGCESYTYKDAKAIRGRILLVSRGKCSFYDKVIHAQTAGAKAVIFLNNNKDEEPFIVTATNAAASKKKKVIIPSFMISQRDALSLIKMRSKPLRTFQVKNLPSVDDDPNANISLLYRGEKIKNLVIINV
ncbi:unnamed protein product [Mucor hiemalis]